MGDEFNIGGDIQVVYETLSVISTDNPASNSLGGFKESSSANLPCRHCLATRQQSKSMVCMCVSIIMVCMCVSRFSPWWWRRRCSVLLSASEDHAAYVSPGSDFKPPQHTIQRSTSWWKCYS